MHVFFTKQVTCRARSVGKYAASEPEAKTAAELRIRLNGENVVKWSCDYLFRTNPVTNMPHIFESTDHYAVLSTEALCLV